MTRMVKNVSVVCATTASNNNLKEEERQCASQSPPKSIGFVLSPARQSETDIKTLLALHANQIRFTFFP